MPGARLSADLYTTEFLNEWDVLSRGAQRILVHRQTAFQEMIIATNPQAGKFLLLDGKFQSAETEEHLYHEPLVQPACIFHGAPRRVLVIGGGEGATLREALRWNSVERALMIDIDGELVEACREHLAEMHQGAFDDPRAQFIAADANAILDTTEERFDVIIGDLSDPMEDSPACELFTVQFYRKLRRVLAPGGVVCVQGGPLTAYEAPLHGRLHHTLAAAFPHVRTLASFVPTYVSLWAFLVASEKELPTDVDPQAVDSLLAKQLRAPLRTVDGVALRGMLHTPGYVRRAIAENREIYSLDNPPEAFGKGSLK